MIGDKLEINQPGYDLPVERTNHLNNGNRILVKLRELCRWRQDSFPGSQPISLTRLNMETLGRTPFLACEKSDGVRYMLFAASEKVFLIDRMETVRCLDMHLPCRHAFKKRHHLTVLDGELVVDEIPASNSNEPSKQVIRFLVYDGVRINNQSIAELNLLDRLVTIYTDVIQPRISYMESNPEEIQKEKSSNNFLEIYLKDFFEIWDIQAIENFSKKLPHSSDGIIFTSVFSPYIPGTCSALLKWKPSHLNTVDFFVDLVTETQTDSGRRFSRKVMGARLFISRKHLRFFTGKWLALKGEKYKEFFDRFEKGDDSVNMTIWECYYDKEATSVIPKVTCEPDRSEIFDFTDAKEEVGGWCVERIRTDKTNPNDENVMKRILESINDGVTLSDLLNTFQLYREAGKPSVLSLCNVPDYYSKQNKNKLASETTVDPYPSKKIKLV